MPNARGNLLLPPFLSPLYIKGFSVYILLLGSGGGPMGHTPRVESKEAKKEGGFPSASPSIVLHAGCIAHESEDFPLPPHCQSFSRLLADCVHVVSCVGTVRMYVQRAKGTIPLDVIQGRFVIDGGHVYTRQEARFFGDLLTVCDCCFLRENKIKAKQCSGDTLRRPQKEIK